MYIDCAERGELIVCGGAVSNVLLLLQAALDQFGSPPVALASDRWREGELRDALKAAGVPLAALELRGQGFRDGGEDVRDFHRAFAEGRVVPVPSLLLASAMAEARCAVDPAGNAKLAKGKEGGRRMRARDDAAAAAILAGGDGLAAASCAQAINAPCAGGIQAASNQGPFEAIRVVSRMDYLVCPPLTPRPVSATTDIHHHREADDLG